MATAAQWILPHQSRGIEWGIHWGRNDNFMLLQNKLCISVQYYTWAFDDCWSRWSRRAGGSLTQRHLGRASKWYLSYYLQQTSRGRKGHRQLDIINSAPSWQKSKQMICFVLFATHMKRQKRTQTTVSFAQCNLGRVTKQMISEHTLCLISWHWALPW